MKNDERNANLKKKVGRPTKATFEEKRAIIDAFFIAEGGEDASVFREHGIYKRLAEFQLSKTLNLQAHDFSRDKDIVEYMKTFTPSEPEDTALPAYTPLDINKFLGRSVKDQIELLRQRESYYNGVYQRGNKAISTYAEVVKERDAAIREREMAWEEVRKANQKAEKLASELAKKKAELKESEAEAADLSRYIKNQVAPNMADAFMDVLKQRDPDDYSGLVATYVTGEEPKPKDKKAELLEKFNTYMENPVHIFMIPECEEEYDEEYEDE